VEGMAHGFIGSVEHLDAQAVATSQGSRGEARGSRRAARPGFPEPGPTSDIRNCPPGHHVKPLGAAPDGDDFESAGPFGWGGMPTGLSAYDMYKSGHRWRDRYAAVARKYIRVRPEIVAGVDRLLAGAGPMIGIHYRHPGHNSECPRPIPSVSEFVRRARAIGRGREVATVLATDVEQVVDEFGAAFGANLIVQPGVQRSATGSQRLERTSDDGSLDDARQVLVDALMLARCDVLVHVTSNVVTAVGYLNPSVQMVYCETALEAWGNWATREAKSVVGRAVTAVGRMPAVGPALHRIRG